MLRRILTTLTPLLSSSTKSVPTAAAWSHKQNETFCYCVGVTQFKKQKPHKLALAQKSYPVVVSAKTGWPQQVCCVDLARNAELTFDKLGVI